ncbi:heterogeneous nuclear ribonucleoprotein U-like protein 2 isoform X2 [Watersipora subatra]|uniref:heterogeneous nuclear ribonucleoprotein U-like protein 2 isoform X2 n=1 Tax=Watersipora subatra TaxID=2589382 RepID=UPI00355C9A9E
MSDVDISKLKVTELREELKKHGLDTKGKKEQLVKRLENFISGSAEGDASLGEGDPALSQEEDAAVETSQETAEEMAAPAEPAAEPEPAAEKKESADESLTEEKQSKMEAEQSQQPSAEEQMDQTEEIKAESTNEKQVDPAEDNSLPSEGNKEEPADEKPETTTEETAGEKRKRSHSPDVKDETGLPSYKKERREEPPMMESLDWVESEDLTLDRYNCDLNVEVINDGFTMKPNSYAGFGYMWGGLRGNYGVTKGKVAFQMKTVKNMRIQIGEESLGANHVSRVGWSVDCGNYQLGEYPKSWGYGGTAKLSTDSKFTDFNVKFYNGDVVTCYLDMTGEENVVMHFAKNDMEMKKAVEIPKADLNGEALFPAFASKNQILEVNFGQMEKPWFPLLGEEGEYTFLGKVPVEDRVRALKPPMSKADCEVLLLVGLPGAGKSYWAAQRQHEEPAKRHYVLGTNNIIDKMKVEGLPRKANYSGRWDVLFDQANECLRKMLETATKRNKNYILDQTNVYDTAQRRKMRPFVGFKRKAVVVLPTDKVFRERIEKRTKEEGKEVPETAVLEMKANFSMPTAPVEIALNPEANEVAIKEEEERLKKEEEEKLAKEEEQRVKDEEQRVKDEEKRAKEEEQKANEESETTVKEDAEESKEKSEQAEPMDDSQQKETADPAEETPAADAVKTEKAEVKQEVSDEPAADATTETAQTDVEDKIKNEETKVENGDDKAESGADGNSKTVPEAPKEEELVFDEVWFTELSGDVARELLARYVKEGQVKFPPGSRRFRREDRRIGKDDRFGGFRNDYRRDGYDSRRDYQGYYGGGNRYGGGYNQGRGGYDNRYRSYQGSGGYSGPYPKGGPGGYRSGGYGKSYGQSGYGSQGGGWGGQGGGWGGYGGNQGYGSQGGWGSGYGQGGYNQGGYQGGSGYGSGGSWGSGGHGGGSSWSHGYGGYGGR